MAFWRHPLPIPLVLIGFRRPGLRHHWDRGRQKRAEEEAVKIQSKENGGRKIRRDPDR